MTSSPRPPRWVASARPMRPVPPVTITRTVQSPLAHCRIMRPDLPARGAKLTERLYYRDSGVVEFHARVVAIHNPGERAGVVLDRTAFYPTSGGQPFDTGTLDGRPVLDVVDEGDAIEHIVASGLLVVGQDVVG